MLPSNYYYYLLLRPKRFHFPNWNVAGVLWSAALHYRYRFYRWEKKIGGRHHRHWMNPVIQKEQFLSCRLASSRAQTEPSLKWAESGGISVGISFTLAQKVQFCFFFIVLGRFCFFARSPTGDKQFSLFWVPRDSFSFTVSNLMAHPCRGNKSMQLSARCSWPYCAVCMKLRKVLVVRLHVSGS